MSLKAQIMTAAKSRRGKKIPVKAWDVDCFVRVMTGTERDAFEGELYKTGKMNKDKFRAKLLARTIADDEGNRVFTDEDANELSENDSVELDRLYDIAADANGLSAKEVDELTKNSSSGQAESSTTA